jgi:DUF438 domain-containing protein
MSRVVDRCTENSIRKEEGKMGFRTDSFQEKWVSSILDKIPMAVTIFDLRGIMLYYNEFAPSLINRKPELLGKDIRLCHKKPESNARIDWMIEEFRKGRREPIFYEARPYGKLLLVTVSPLEVDGRLVACIHTAMPKP